ncbi:MAG TPA: alpha/beta hydrolase [Pseudidiomarina sp.]|nr:alpha/beta hydrolase [Pseudidiomarina sp.]
MRILGHLAWLFFGGIALLLILWWAPDKPVQQLYNQYAQAPSQFAQVNGMTVHYRVEGVANSKPPLILLHGTSASLHTWNGWVAELGDQQQIIRLDLPGFALTGPRADDDYRVETYANFVADFATQIGVQEFVLGGNSLGGYIAWKTAEFYPERVLRLILVDPSGGYAWNPEELPLGFRIAQSPLLSYSMEYFLPKFMIRRSVENVYGDPSRVTDDLVQLYYDMTLREGNRRALRLRFALQQSRDESNTLRKLTQPTLIIWGGRDRLIPVANAHRYATDLPNNVLVIFPELGHVPHEEAPAQTAEAVRAFLR